MSRVYNFSAGPSVLPESVLKKAADEMLDYNGSGQSVMEMSHRSKVYDEIIKSCEASLRRVMNIPDNYKVLFLQGGASSQFAMIPLNLMNKNNKADFVITGQWAKKAYAEAARYGTANVVASSADRTFSYIPKLDLSTFDKDADYFHICMNNTLYGTKFKELPDTGDVPLVADVSSCILSEPIDVKKFGVLYAGAQKNVGPAGVTIVIVRKDLQDRAMQICPTMLKWKTQTEKKSLYNTPPCWSTYVAMEVFAYLKERGGVKAMHEINVEKAKILYDFIDDSEFYTNNVAKEDRSLMNVPFISPSPELDAKFVAEAAQAGLVSIKGHRLVGGMRASIYNAMPVEGVKALVDFMKKFEKENS